MWRWLRTAKSTVELHATEVKTTVCSLTRRASTFWPVDTVNTLLDLRVQRSFVIDGDVSSRTRFESV
jgi:hypothetical protein